MKTKIPSIRTAMVAAALAILSPHAAATLITSDSVLQLTLPTALVDSFHLNVTGSAELFSTDNHDGTSTLLQHSWGQVGIGKDTANQSWATGLNEAFYVDQPTIIWGTVHYSEASQPSGLYGGWARVSLTFMDVTDNKVLPATFIIDQNEPGTSAGDFSVSFTLEPNHRYDIFEGSVAGWSEPQVLHLPESGGVVWCTALAWIGLFLARKSAGVK
jgi:hypothetical protein